MTILHLHVCRHVVIDCFCMEILSTSRIFLTKIVLKILILLFAISFIYLERPPSAVVRDLHWHKEVLRKANNMK